MISEGDKASRSDHRQNCMSCMQGQRVVNGFGDRNNSCKEILHGRISGHMGVFIRQST